MQEPGQNDASKELSNFNGVLTYTNPTSISDYFSNKMKKKLQNGQVEEELTIVNSDQLGSPIREPDLKRDGKTHGKRKISCISSEMSEFPEAKKKKCRSESDTKIDMTIVNGHSQTSIISDAAKALKSCLRKVRDNVANKCVQFCDSVNYRNISPLLTEEIEEDVQIEAEWNHEDDNKSNSECMNDPFKEIENLSEKAEIENEESLSSETSKGDLDGVQHDKNSNKKIVVDDEAKSVAQKSLTNEIKPDRSWVCKPFAIGHYPTAGTTFNKSESWSSATKLAEKMNHYSSIFKNIQEHNVLSTTNLLDIKGYGT